MSRMRLKEHLIKNGVQYECKLCGINEWMGKKLSLHLDHINGINNDNELDNLRFLCPNCHSLTHTYCGKNNKTKFNTVNKKVSDDVLIKSMLLSKNVKEALNSVGLSGAENYKRVYRLAESNNIVHMMESKLRNKIFVDNLRKSNIDFTKFGWVEKASKVLNISSQKTRIWIAKNCPDLLENAFLRKEGDEALR